MEVSQHLCNNVSIYLNIVRNKMEGIIKEHHEVPWQLN